MVQVIGQGRVKPKSTAQQFGEAFSRLGQGVSEHFMSESLRKKEDEALKREYGIDFSGVRDPHQRKLLAEKAQLELNKGSKLQGAQDVQSIYAKGLRGEALTDEEMSKLPVNAQTQLAKFRQEPKEPVKRLSEKPIDPEQLEAKKRAKNVPGYDEMDELEKYDTLINSGVAPILAEKEAKLTSEKLGREQNKFDKAYDAQKDFISKTTDSFKAYETETKPKLLQMQKIASDEDLIGPTSAVFLDTLGIPLGALEDPSSELYNKVSLDLLKGLPETYGNRIMKVEVDNFLKTIPTLLNSPDGRRMIASNMLKLGEMKEVYYNEMRRQQKDAIEKNKMPRDFQQSVFDQVKPQIEKINNEFVKMSEIKSVPKGKVPFFAPNGTIQFVPKEHVEWAIENGGKRIW